MALISLKALRHNVRMAKQRHFLKQWRRFRGYTQERLAEMIGCDQSFVSKVETFKKPYDEQYLERAAEALRTEVVDLLIRDPSKPEGIWSIWDQLAPAQQEQVVEVAKVLKRTGTNG